MLLSLILAWVAVFSAAMATLKVVARLSGKRKLNRFFHKCHIPFGIILLAAGLLHGILAGNASWATLADAQFAPVLLTWNWGTACLVVGILLAVTYLLRRRLRRLWMSFHRILTVVFIAFLVLHVSEVGIQMGERFFGQETVAAVVTAQSGNGDTDSMVNTNSADDTNSAESTAAEEDGANGMVTFSGAVLKDGTYEGSAQGYHSTITVSVVVSGGEVTDLAVVSQDDTPSFFSRAEVVLDEITGQQSLEVDAVTGATYSSTGLINAVADALQNAVVSGTLQVAEITLPTSHHGAH